MHRPIPLTSWDILLKVWRVIFRRHYKHRVYCDHCTYHGPVKGFVPQASFSEKYFKLLCPICSRCVNVCGVMIYVMGGIVSDDCA